MHRPELTDVPSGRDGATPDATAGRSPGLRVAYLPADVAASTTELLAAVSFGVAAAAPKAPVQVHVRLEPGPGAAFTECWFAAGPVMQGRSGNIRFAHDSHHLFAVSELDDREHDGLRAAAEQIYAEMQRFQQQSDFPHLLRIWNYMDAINGGQGDEERYRQFCVGRLRGLGDANESKFPAASALGHQHRTHQLQVYWLASRTPGVHIENPRQVSAYRYPKVHGPVSPSFARATLTQDGALLISGTASIVGHISQHVGDPLAQLEEIVRNLATLGAAADGNTAPGPVLLKVYVRDPAHVPAIEQRLKAVYPHCSVLFLAADICRRELLLEIESVRLAC